MGWVVDLTIMLSMSLVNGNVQNLYRSILKRNQQDWKYNLSTIFLAYQIVSSTRSELGSTSPLF